MQLHRLKGYIQNIYLIEYEHGCMLLDGGCRADFDIVSDYFRTTLKRPLTDLKVVMVTHMHPDHAGCAHYLREKTGCLVVSGVFEHHWYEGLSGRFSHLTDILLTHWVAGRLGRKRRLIWYPRKLRADVQLQDGQPVPGFEQWSIVATPGHTHMDISIYSEKHELIYVADLIVSNKKQLTPPYPVHFPNIYRESVAKLKAFEGFKILMAHVEPQTISTQVLDDIMVQTPKVGQSNKQAIFNIAKKHLGFGFDSQKS
ncbi:MBL fold metallo-hydrolase [Glaciecola sp. XM2]|jgi:glyoxylase-like metal-dependent hydrolase (beta-lactamase superfamily II)|uniref:MBL fold metallo-hydrolase n=1 Tax=Glaciecola sp. XM2 TaxID=1914931 RepID=UPI001BDDD53F|nr:MBL fold metallo-hydrolase [Glaciecola sp. XM2]MBT1451673.1 MBL fold metallo-hydrolase [Glaciecola sp. XM2]